MYELEAALGMSKGYIGRICREAMRAHTLPEIEQIAAIAAKLHDTTFIELWLEFLQDARPDLISPGGRHAAALRLEDRVRATPPRLQPLLRRQIDAIVDATKEPRR